MPANGNGNANGLGNGAGNGPPVTPGIPPATPPGQAPVAQDDSFLIAEDLILLGDLFADNGSGVDSDPNGDPFTVAEVNGQPVDALVPVTTTTAGGRPVSFFVAPDGTLSWTPSVEFQSLALGETDSFTFSYTISDGQFSSAQPATVTVTIDGRNDAPTLDPGTLAATEDGPTVSLDLSVLGDDIDSDDDGTTLNYMIVGSPAKGSASISGTDLTFDPGTGCQDMAEGETRDVSVLVQATDQHGEHSTATSMIVTVNGRNDAPTLAAGVLTAVEDGPSVTLDLATKGDDIDSDDDGSSLTYSVVGQPTEGSASISGTTLTFDPGTDFQDLNDGETRDVTVQIQATDQHGEVSLVNSVVVTVQGEDDLPQSFGVLFAGVAAGDLAGRSVASAGDVNADGIADIIIGAYAADPGGKDLAGETYIVFGRDALTNGGFETEFDLSSLNGSNGFVLTGIDDTDLSGAHVASVGDLNHDGIDDFCVGATWADPNGNAKAGQAYVVFGRDTLSGNTYPVLLDPSSLDGTNGFTVNGVSPSDFAGNGVSSAGDINGDGIDDLIVSSPGASDDGVIDAGQTYIVFGKDTIAEGHFAATLNPLDLDGSNGFVLKGIGAEDLSGFSVSSLGDVNGDGVDDLIVGAPNADTALQDTGESYVLFGRVTGDKGAFPAEFDLSSLDGSNGFTIRGIDRVDISGFSVSSAGDFNADGIDDILIGAYGADQDTSDGRTGEAYVVFGKGSETDGGFGASVNLAELNGTNGTALIGTDYRDYAAWSVSHAGDVNGDGIDDILIGAWGANPGGQSTAGETYLVFGRDTSKDGNFSATHQLSSLDGTDGYIFNGIASGDESGFAVSSAGDVNNDGVGDILIGAWKGDPDGAIDAGEVYLVYGGSNLLNKFDHADGSSNGQIDLSLLGVDPMSIA
jgi:VCBS repeat-containing protein